MTTKQVLIFLILSASVPSVWGKKKAPAPLRNHDEITLEWGVNSANKHWLFAKNPIYHGPAHLAPLASVKKLELEQNYEGCTQQVLKIWPQFHDFHGWMAIQGTQCLINQLKFATVRTPSLYSRWWTLVYKQSEKLPWGPWTTELLRSWNEFTGTVIKESQLPLKFRAEVAEVWRQYTDSLKGSERQDLYKIITDNLKASGEESLAEAVVSRESALKVPDNGSAASNGKKGLDSMNILAQGEDDAAQKVTESFKQNQLATGVEMAVQFLERYPNGNRSAQVQEKLFQSYFNFSEAANAPDFKAQMDRTFALSKRLQSSRLAEWAKAAHRRADFRGALVFAKNALPALEGSVDGAALLFIAGRSAAMTGAYREAIGHFDQLVTRHYGYPEYWEIKFRRALAFLRLQEDDKAEEALNELWSSPDNKTYGLSSLYWLIRLKQKRGRPVEDLLQVMQAKFPLTYYGLKLNAESHQKKIVGFVEPTPTPSAIKQSWALTPSEKRQWERAEALMTAGWYVAAQGELSNLILSGNAEQKFLWSQHLAQMFAYPQALRQYSELIDLDPRWRQLTYLKTVFPKPLEHVVQMEAAKNELNPLLVFSLIRQESAFNLAATSRSQAKGLMQLIPPTANEVAADLRLKNFNSDQMYHPLTNLKFGTFYLAKVIRQFGGNVSVGLAAYNAGPQRLKKFFEARPEVENPDTLSMEDPWSDLWFEELPWLETNLYVKSILRNRVIYELIEQGSFEWPAPVWKDLFLGTKRVSKAPKKISSGKRVQ